MSMERFVHENKPGLCVLGVIFGIPLTTIGALSIAYADGGTGVLKWAHDLIGNWGFWIIIIGLILLIPGAYYLVVFVKQLREFKEMMATDSKQLFIKNQDRIEELAWRLHPKYEKMVIEKKAKLKVK